MRAQNTSKASITSIPYVLFYGYLGLRRSEDRVPRRPARVLLLTALKLPVPLQRDASFARHSFL